MSMKKFMIRIPAAILIVVILSAFLPGRAGAAFAGDREIASKGACVLDFETGTLLYGHEENTKRVPASMTKLLTVFVVYDAIRAGEIGLGSEVRISEEVSDFSYDWRYSNVPLPKDALIKVDVLLDVVLVASACAATVALGEALCGDEEGFIKRMNEKVAKLGIDAVFYDTNGISPDNRISPYGMAVLSLNLLKEHPEVLDKTKKKTITYRSREYKNTNPLLGEYSGMDGLKTGYTDPAGYCFTGTAERGGRRLITVTMGSSTVQKRSEDHRILLDYGFKIADSVINGQTDDKAGVPDAGGTPGSEAGDSGAYLPNSMEGYRLLILRAIELAQNGADVQSEMVLIYAYILSTLILYSEVISGTAP